MDIVYGFGLDDGDTVVFALRESVERVAQINRALQESKTWGEFRAKLPEGEWDDSLESMFDEAPQDDEPFDAGEVPGVNDGDYPPWLAKEQLRWLPRPLIKKHGGEVYETMFNGTSVTLPADKAEEIANDLRAMGHTVERIEAAIY